MLKSFRAWTLFLAALGCLQAQGGPSWTWTRMEGEVTRLADAVEGRVGVFIQSLDTGESFALRADEVFPAASTIKLALLLELYRQCERPGPRLTDPYLLDPRDLAEDSAILGNLAPGTRLTLRDLALFTVVVSDNSATNILMDRVGMDRVNAGLDALGLRRTRLRRKMMDAQAAREGRENLATPRELAGLLLEIHRGRTLAPESRCDLMKLLAIPKDSYLARLLPDGLAVADKTGSLPGVRNDVGIVFVKNRPFVVAVMASHLRDDREGEAVIGRIARSAAAWMELAGAASAEGRVNGTLQVR
ncbi:serine hydrolase [Mesoterricola silvestris]|uniref:Serine hydrolase n=1 Tax=Mesoterricola silvestris TaxID=2927979 RepID=A0AA48K8E9_9BACT|nr:serine hydrolase [Mesoterricola silvestris]BDU72844.1 serine hydrolase [Mesoterricola silvestris]